MSMKTAYFDATIRLKVRYDDTRERPIDLAREAMRDVRGYELHSFSGSVTVTRGAPVRVASKSSAKAEGR